MDLQIIRLAEPFKQLIGEYKLLQHEELNSQLKIYIEKLKLEDSRGISKSNTSGWHSKEDLHKHENPHIQIFHKLLYTSIGSYIKSYDESLDIRKFELKIGSWANVNLTGGSNVAHCHPNSLVSGTYYVNLPDTDIPKIRFFNMSGTQHLKNKSVLGCRFIPDVHSITPSAGSLIIFPSSLYHSVDVNLTNQPRISIAFNGFLEKKGTT